MKTVVLALDALEPSLLDLWGLEEFNQKHLGLYDASELEELSTPICFSALLTGKNPSDYGYTLEYLRQGLEEGYATWLKPLYWVRRNLLGGFKDLGFRNKARDIGIFQPKSRNMPERLKDLTIFRRLELDGYGVYTDNVPSYDEVAEETYRGQIIHLIGKTFLEREKHIRELTESVKSRWLNAITRLEDSELVFFYSPLPDTAHHLIHQKIEMMMLEEVYRSLRDLPMLFELKDVAVLLLSDHGYIHEFDETGKDLAARHSSVGFWSLNVDSEIKPRTVFDFHDLIYELVTK